MRKIGDVKQMSRDQLVSQFEKIAIDEDRALLMNEIALLNKLVEQMRRVAEELMSRPDDQRRAPLRLYFHPNIQVRLKAAVHTLAVAPQAARAKLKEIEDSYEFPQAGDAGMTLWALEEGIFKPS